MRNSNDNVGRVKAALNARAEDVCKVLLPGGKRVGREWHVGDVRGGAGDSLRVCLDGEKTGIWKDFAGGPKDAGDLLALWQRCRGVDFKTALHDAAGWTGVSLNSTGAGGNGMLRGATGQPEPVAAAERKALRDMGAEWDACVVAMGEPELARLAKWRGYSIEFVRWVKTQRLIGIHEGSIAFPVHGAGKVIGWHYRIKADGSWRYFPAGIGAHPFVIGDLSGFAPVFCFESQWDALAALDACGWEDGKRQFAVVATRGASNAARLADVIEAGSSAILWPQNDDAGLKWGVDAVRALSSCKVKIATVPSPHKDAADWQKAGAGSAAFAGALGAARLVHEAARVEVGGEAFEDGMGALPSPGKFPLEALPAVMREVVKIVAATYELPPELPAMAALATWAGAIGKGAVVRGAVNGRDTFCNLFIFVGAPKSFGKGSAAAVVRPLLELSQQFGEEFRKQELPGILARLKEAKRESTHLVEMIVGVKRGKRVTVAEKDEMRERLKVVEANIRELEWLTEGLPSYHAGSATGAALAMVLRRNGGMIFSFSPEAGDMVRVALGRYTADGKADADLLLSGYTVEPFKENRVQRGETDIIPCISTLWFCQPSLLREIIGNEEAFERGLTARALMFCCEREGPIPYDDGVVRSLETAAMEAWAAALAEIVKLREAVEPLVIGCHADARAIFRAFHNEAVDYRNGRFRDMEAELGRWRENAIRIAGGLAVAEGASTITPELATRAVSLAEWAQLSGLALIHAGAESRRRSRLEKVVGLAREAGGWITLRKLRDSHGVTAAEAEHLAQLHPSRLAIEDRPAGAKGGRISRGVKLATA